ncbi:hypothetical protein EMCG_01134 [[Emmonsia] crescens]|uniref:Uncharacterized protein n=1 Tax=[Emmonsia] crescens TaxID=73230 RepID=A0A0G2I7G9_9EURO|nr:hypothetical protein EMCG_01134 [Emmonsia crescens UAMH 3008]
MYRIARRSFCGFWRPHRRPSIAMIECKDDLSDREQHGAFLTGITEEHGLQGDVLGGVTFSGDFQRAPTRIGRGADGFLVGGSATNGVSRRGLDLAR